MRHNREDLPVVVVVAVDVPLSACTVINFDTIYVPATRDFRFVFSIIHCFTTLSPLAIFAPSDLRPLPPLPAPSPIQPVFSVGALIIFGKSK